MTPTRQQRRARERDRAKLYREILRDGLPASNGLAGPAVVMQHLVGLMGNARDARRASRAADAVHQVFDASLKNHPPRRAVACTAGCATCCTQLVSVSIPDVLRLARHLRRDRADDVSAIRARLDAKNDALATVDAADRPVFRFPCALLAGDLCSVYAHRPLSCRGYASHALEACLAVVEDPAIEVPVPVANTLFRMHCAAALWATLRHHGLSHQSYELTAALDVALKTDDAEARWLAGEDVFAGVPVDTSRAPEIETLLDRLTALALG